MHDISSESEDERTAHICRSPTSNIVIDLTKTVRSKKLTNSNHQPQSSDSRRSRRNRKLIEQDRTAHKEKADNSQLFIDRNEGTVEHQIIEHNNNTEKQNENETSNTESEISEKNWTHTDTIKLIELLKCSPQLWDTKANCYNDKTLKSNTLLHFSKYFEKSIPEVTRKIKNMRGQMRKELKKIKNNQNHKSGWAYFNIMNFMINNILETRTRPQKKNKNAPKLKSCSSYALKKVKNGKIPNEQKNQYIDISDSEDKMEFGSVSTSTNNIEIVDGKTRKMLVIPSDEYQIFGEYVASELRNLKLRSNKNKLKRQIQKLVIDMSAMDDDM